MKRLMYTQLFYDSVYFAFEGQWEYVSGATKNRTGLTPIGMLQQQAKKFFASTDTPDLGVHVRAANIVCHMWVMNYTKGDIVQ